MISVETRYQWQAESRRSSEKESNMQQSPVEDHHATAIRAVEELRSSIEGPLSQATALSWASQGSILVAQLVGLAKLAD